MVSCQVPRTNPNISTPTYPQDECPLLAMAFVNSQPFNHLYDISRGFHRGTIFADLDKPFEGGCIR